METRKRRSNRRSRLWAMALAAALACALLLGAAQAAPATGAAIMPDDAAPKPVVTIQGNVVVDKGKPTGFYELALCVRTARTVTLKDGTPVSEATYAAELAAALESGKKEDRDALDAKYDVQNYPFQSAAATVHIDLDALTAVTWGAGTPVYEDWTAAGTTGGNGTYANYNIGYPRGLDLSGAVEQPDIFTNLDKIINGTAASVRLDTANPDEMTNATALVEDYDAASRTALLTLSANTTTSANVVYETETPVVVVRFAYDLDRFRKTDVLTQPNQSDFWLGLDRNATGGPNTTGQKALTFLAAGDLSGDLSASDAQAAEASIHQAVWYSHNMLSDQTSQKSTNFYYYLGAETPATQGTGTYVVIDGGTVVTPSPTLTIPKTQGNAVLARHSDAYATTGDPDAGKDYSFFQNLLTMKEGTLRLELVNAETYRKPAGGGGTTILFYDWDGSLIGSLVVDKGDVRAEVNEYVEQNLVHPDLRASQYLNNGKVPELTDPTRGDYANLLNSLERQYTYRGKYPFEVGGSQIQNDPSDATVLDGSEYPLTNKLDYAFYRRVNRITEDTDVNGAKTNYYSTSSLLEAENLDAALYPYVYGWAVVEDATTLNQTKWQVRRDAEKLEDVWTTIGVGELANVKPGVGRTDTPIPAAGGGTRTVLEPAFIAAETEKNPVAPPTDYQYTTASTEANRYFRFADFSDIDAELERYTRENGSRKNTLIVKAVYEPGESLLDGFQYRLISEPAYTKWNDKAAANGGAYRVVLTMERSYDNNGQIVGTSRVREPAVQQDTTTDAKWIVSENPEVDHDLNNPTTAVAGSRSETTYSKVETDNGEQITFSLSLSARMNKVDYLLAEQYGMNYITGTQRSNSNADQSKKDQKYFVPDNYNYFLEGDSDVLDKYYDCEFETKEGSHGFVLYCTLGHMLQQATSYNRGEIDRQTLGLTIGNTIAKDANLRMDLDGTMPSFSSNSVLQQAFINAAAACENHRNDPAYNCWDENLNCAKLSYHQMQWYILDGGSGDIRTVADADDDKLSFCTLHSACADLMSNKPKNWADVMEAAAANDRERLEKLTLTELEDLTYLRATSNGAPYNNINTFIARLMAVVTTTSDNDWVSVQNRLLYGAGSKDTYWWYDGAVSNNVASWNSLMVAVDAAIGTPVTYKDGLPVGQTKAKMEGARAIFEANAGAYKEGQNTATRAWVNLTYNLVASHIEMTVNIGTEEEPMMEWQYQYVPYQDFGVFQDALVDAVKALQDASMEVSWKAVQYMMLFPGTTPAEMVGEPWDNVTLDNVDDWVYDPDTSPLEKKWPEGLWWEKANVPLTVSNIATLLKAMAIKNDVNSEPEDVKRADEALAKVSLERLEGKNFWLRKSQRGEGWLERDETGAVTGPDAATQATLLAQVLETVKNAQTAGAYNWNTLQYYLIHGSMAMSTGPGGDPALDLDKMNREATYYWWARGSEGTRIDFTGTNLQTVFALLSEASLRGEQFGDPLAVQSVKDAAGERGGYKDWLRLTTSPLAFTQEDGRKRSELAHFADDDPGTTALLAAMDEFAVYARQVQRVDVYAPPDVMDWHQVQYWLLHPELPEAQRYINLGTDPYKEAQETYWWYDQEEKPKEVETKNPEPSDPMVENILKWCAGSLTDAALKNTLTAAKMNTTYKIYRTATGGTHATAPPATMNSQLNASKTKMLNLAKAVKASEYYDADNNTAMIYWAQIQYFWLNNTLVDNQTALQWLVDKGWCKPGGTGTVKKIPNEVDLSVLNP